MLTSKETRLRAPGVRSPAWDGDVLVDWVGGGQRYLCSDEALSPPVIYAYSFDAATSLPGSSYCVIYKRCGTKALVLQQGKLVRELNRSFYHAEAYEYPIVQFRLPSGREVLAHCPDEYCRLEIEDIATGEVLTRSGSRKPNDFFHSRLRASPDGRHLASAGWIWHPVDSIQVYDILAALDDPSQLDRPATRIDAFAEESSATFLSDGRLVIALMDDIDAQDSSTARSELRTYDPPRMQDPTVVSPVGRLGTLAAIGRHHVLALHRHPRLIDVCTGAEVLSWPHLQSGTQISSILLKNEAIPVIAVDAVQQRFALADAEGITVVQLEGDLHE